MPQARLSPRFAVAAATAGVWALAAGSAVFWALRLGGAGAPPAPVAAPVGGAASIDARAVARALGAHEGARAPQATDAGVAQRLALRGVLTHGADGAALIAIDGQPARPLRVGAALAGLEGGWTLQQVEPHAVVLAAEGRQARLELPPLDQRSRATDAVAPVVRPGARPLGLPAVPRR